MKMEKEATIEEKIRIRKKEKAKRRGAANRRMEQGQPSKKKRRVEEGVEEDPIEDHGKGDIEKPRIVVVETPK